jgi:hypothetical protein
VGKPEGKRPLGRPRRRWVDNIRMDLGEVGWGGVDWIGLAEDRNRWGALVKLVLNLRGKLSSGLSSSAQLLKSYVKNLSDIHLQSQLRNFIDVIISLCITTCFGPYGPSSGEYNYYLKHLRESHRYPNGSVVHKFVTYYKKGKYVVIYNGITSQH